MLKAIIAGTVVMLAFPIGAAKAQGEQKYKWEAGFQVTTIQFGVPAEKPIGFGGRIGRELDISGMKIARGQSLIVTTIDEALRDSE